MAATPAASSRASSPRSTAPSAPVVDVASRERLRAGEESDEALRQAVGRIASVKRFESVCDSDRVLWALRLRPAPRLP